MPRGKRSTRRRFGRGEAPTHVSLIVTAPALPQTERHDAFLHSVTSGRERRGAPSDNERTLLDRTLKKATDANYVRHRESSIKTITKKNFGGVPTSPTLLLVPSLRAINVVT